jgi:hypothetical protein
MFKNYIVIFICFILWFLLSGCENNKVSSSKENIKKQVSKVENVLRKIWLTGEKYEQELKKQKEAIKILNNLTWDVKKRYILEKKILPRLSSNSKLTPKYCKTNNLDLYTKCMTLKWVSLNKILKDIPREYQDVFKRKYYYQRYKSNYSLIVKEFVKDPIAIQAKKKVVKEMIDSNILTKLSVCEKIPEKQVKDFCESQFK